MNMVLYPIHGSVVVYCHAGRMHIIARDDWAKHKSKAEPLAVLSDAEGSALAWFLKYWLGDDSLRPGYRMKSINAEFDF